MLKVLNIVRRLSSSTNKNIGIIGVPFSDGQKKQGVGHGPKYLREGGLIKDMQSISESLNIKDYGDIEYKIETDSTWHRTVENMDKLDQVSFCCKALSQKVQEILKDGRTCISLGGDHSIAIGSIDGHVKHSGEISLIWVDAHMDLNTNATSPSGNIHGMPLALLLKELEDYWPYIGPNMDWQKPMVSVKNVALVGLRSVDEYERAFTEKLGIKVFGMREVEISGIKEVMSQALNHVDPYQERSLHISFDIDSLDPNEAPSTGTAVRGGLTLREGIYIMEEAYNTGRLTNVDLVEVNPSIGTDRDVKKTIESANMILCAAAGNNRAGNYSPTDKNTV